MTMTNQKIQYTEEMVGQNHATKSDTLNRLCVGVNNFRLIKSGSNLTLEAVNGNLVDIAGNVYAVTSLPTLSAAGLGVGTLYYIYLYSNSGTATLEASSTAFTVDSAGRANKTGDSTRRLMGLARPITGPAWVDSAQQRLVLSRDNRIPLVLEYALPADRTTTSGTAAELNTADRLEFVAFGSGACTVSFTGAVAGSETSTVTTRLYLIGGYLSTTNATVTAASQYYPTAITSHFATTVGYHYISLYGAVTSGTGTWQQYGTMHGLVV